MAWTMEEMNLSTRFNLRECHWVCPTFYSFFHAKFGIWLNKTLVVEDHESDIRVDPRSLANMGEISVYVVRTRRIPNSNRFPAPRAAVELASIERVNEKSLKGKDLTHVTKYVHQPYIFKINL